MKKFIDICYFSRSSLSISSPWSANPNPPTLNPTDYIHHASHRPPTLPLADLTVRRHIHRTPLRQPRILRLPQTRHSLPLGVEVQTRLTVESIGTTTRHRFLVSRKTPDREGHFKLLSALCHQRNSGNDGW